MALGTVRVAVLFVDFPNAVASHSTQAEAELGLPYTEAYLEASSYGMFDIEFFPLHQWLRAERNFEDYLGPTALEVNAVGHSIAVEAAGLADPHFDFTDYESVMVVMPSSHFGGGLAVGTISTDEGSVYNSALINTFPLDQLSTPHWWGSVGAHELTHNLGLLDLYPYDPTRKELPEAPTGKTWVTSGFGLMGLQANFLVTGHEPSLTAEEMLAWSRWQLGWLDATQISCVTENEATVTLSPVAEPGDSIAMAAIPLSGTEVIVIEGRRKIGYDTPRNEHFPDGVIRTFPALLTEGVLVYTVNAALRSGELPLVIAGDTGNLQVDRYPILTDGKSITIRGYTITVESSTDTTHTVTITKNTE